MMMIVVVVGVLMRWIAGELNDNDDLPLLACVSLNCSDGGCGGGDGSTAAVLLKVILVGPI